LEERVRGYADDVFSNLKTAYQKEATIAARDGRKYPVATTTLRKISEIVGSMTRES